MTTTDTTATPPSEQEKPAAVDIENVATTTLSNAGTGPAVDAERNALLAALPDPDEGKSEEERREIDRKLVWKVDLWLIPWLSLLYLLSFLDRTNIGNARLAGMEDYLDMGPGDYNVALTIFFVSYALFEPITNGLLKRLTPRIFFTGIIIAWGAVMTLMGVCHNYPGLLAARFFLGVAEAGLYPGVNYYLGCWYKSSEIGARAAIFFSAAALAGSSSKVSRLSLSVPFVGGWFLTGPTPLDSSLPRIASVSSAVSS
ncbi:hypothetical protein LB505_010222 [Fusarium chuoi]|nr:hypothetical protein LB505_010222 [Fusarium chuoi]